MIASNSHIKIWETSPILIAIVSRQVIWFKIVLDLFVFVPIPHMLCYFLNKIKSEGISGRYIVNWHLKISLEHRLATICFNDLIELDFFSHIEEGLSFAF